MSRPRGGRRRRHFCWHPSRGCSRCGVVLQTRRGNCWRFCWGGSRCRRPLLTLCTPDTAVFVAATPLLSSGTRLALEYHLGSPVKHTLTSRLELFCAHNDDALGYPGTALRFGQHTRGAKYFSDLAKRGKG